jgi:glutamate carboxypeptidase
MTSQTPSAFLSAAERRLPEALALLRDLVAVNSFTDNAEGVAEVARMTAEAFAPLGFEAAFEACERKGSGPHLFLSRRGRDGGDPIFLVTHSDTVYPPEEELAQGFRWREDPAEGRVYGPGTIDNKGGTALIWLLLHALREAAPAAWESASWIVASNAAEEVTGSDFARAAERRCGGRARAVLVFEGGPVDARGWHLVTSRKGRSTWRLSASGRAAHAGSAHGEGINAIDALAAALPAVAALTSPDGARTVNIGRIDGGTVVNRVPHEAFAEWECRSDDPALLEEADAFFASLSGSSPNGAGLLAVRTGHTPAWPGGPATEDLLGRWQAAAAALVEEGAVGVARGGLSDANHLGHLGPTLDGLGPWGGNAHCSERSADGTKTPEFLVLSSLVPKAAINALALARWIGGA